ncbi:MAG: hypothetical protein MSC30_10930 [Gaiellaceae bacterium MAG52_C11]|nr:hypothetical protein [Candidatus Gaiellasilicea maunaloa]
MSFFAVRAFVEARHQHGPLGGGTPRVGADLARQPEVDLAVTRNRRRALAVEAPVAVVAGFPQESSAVLA